MTAHSTTASPLQLSHSYYMLTTPANVQT